MLAIEEMIRKRNGHNVHDLKDAFVENLYYRRGQAIQTATPNDAYITLAYTIRDFLVDRWQKSVQALYENNPKFVYYLSAEYLLGPQLKRNMLYTNTLEAARDALAELGFDVEEIMEEDVEPGLGNGGLGRLVACFLDSMATLDIPSVGYGIRYQYGIFKQSIRDGWQEEAPDNWLLRGNPWEFEQPDNIVEVGFGGQTYRYTDDMGRFVVRWTPDRYILGKPYHMLIPGYRTGTVNMLRLWSAQASNDFDIQLFNEGDYIRAVEEKTLSESLSKVLYPNDNTPAGRELRLRQQYFFVACSIRDIIRRFRIRNLDWDLFPEKVAIQLNDTHPVIAIPELMRVLVDESFVPWDEAWDVTQRTFAYTCHTLLPEALEKWPVHLFERLLPRHLEIIYEINERFLEGVRHRSPDDPARVIRMSLIEETPEKQIRMAYLATVGSHSVNGVAALHTDLLKKRVLNDFYAFWPERFSNKTNGVNHRRFLQLANPGLSDLITSRIGDGWLTDLEQLRRLEEYLDDASFKKDWRSQKMLNKRRLADYTDRHEGLIVNPTSLFDVMAKRLHEYKRQQLKVLHIITLYNRLKKDPSYPLTPRTFFFGAKAAPGYRMAKLIIKLINSVGAVINNDQTIGDRLRVVFLQNFNVAIGERVYPAADVSEQISLAGKEASGTGNMKFALNGALTIGTLDGANIEIRERVGAENFYLFGLTAEEVFALQRQGYDPRTYLNANQELQTAIRQIADGTYSEGDAALFKPLTDAWLNEDRFMTFADYASYVHTQDRLEKDFLDEEAWTRKSILNTARSGYFAADRTIHEYNRDIWHAPHLRVAPPASPNTSLVP